MRNPYFSKKVKHRLALLLCCFAICYSPIIGAPVFQKVSVTVTKGTLEEVFKQIMRNKNVQIVYEPILAAQINVENVNYNEADIKKILKEVLAKTDLEYEVVDNIYTIKKKQAKRNTRQNLSADNQSINQGNPSKINISGIVYDDMSEPLPGATVRLNTKGIIGTSTDVDGNFSLAAPANIGDTLVISFIGMETKRVVVERGKAYYMVTLAQGSTIMKDVVVNAGIIQRDKHGFTGAYTHATGEELKAVGSQNLLQSLQALDPSFIVSDNSVMGSSPNAMPNVEIRGQSSVDIGTVQDEAAISPNQPLFIMDGFEVTIQEVNDLDMNRVESVTILKDAGSTAIYGSRGANGVIVVETIKPKRGEVFVSYNTDFALSYADLSDYNMMNAAEKLEYELLAGRYDSGIGGSMSDAMSVYNEKLADVRRGVDTYWLKIPLRTAYTQRHSATVSAGSEHVLFMASVNYGNIEGVMKGENRETFGGNVNVTYRKNKLNISNNLKVSGYNSDNSQYEPFSDFVNTNPYYMARNEEGNVSKFLERYDPRTPNVKKNTPNPLYNALLDSESGANSLRVTNNTNLSWYLHDDFMISGAFSISHESTKNLKFISADDTRFDEKDFNEKGSYTEKNLRGWSYDANIYLYYKKTLAEAHNFALIGRGSIQENNSRSTSFVAIGFPSGVGANPSAAYSYALNSRPLYGESISRKMSGLTSLSYNYKLRYIFDANYTIDGANTFGSNKKYAPFWSVGAGWHLKQEEFAKKWEWLSDFSIRSTYGTTASQNTQLTTESTYQYYTGNTLLGQGIYLRKYGNPDLDWEESRELSINFDAGFLNNRLKFSMSYFDTKTDPMVLDISQKPSTGLTTYAVNMGNTKKKGTEFMVTYSPIYRMKDRIYLTFRASGMNARTVFGGLNNLMQNLEFEDGESSGFRDAASSISLRRYRNGYSPDDIWVVRSLGVDPATGREVFLKKDGVTPTFTYDPDDIVKVGSSRPDLQGTFGIAFKYKQFETNLEFQYRIGGSVLNTDLYDKVENITFANLIYNQDKRALYDKWKQPGDIAKYVSVNPKTSRSELVKATSRFIQEENMFACKTIRLSWDFSRDRWLKSLKMSNLKFSMYMNDIFRVSSIKQERSTVQPFQRQINFNLSTKF